MRFVIGSLIINKSILTYLKHTALAHSFLLTCMKEDVQYNQFIVEEQAGCWYSTMY